MWGGIPKGRWGHSSSTCSQAHREHEVPKPIVLLPLLFCQKSRALSTPCFLAPIKVKTDPRSSSASGGRGGDLHSPALPPPCFLSPPQRSFLSHLIFPQLRHIAGRRLPRRSWQSHAERAFSKVLFTVLLFLLSLALKYFQDKHMLWGNYSIQFLWRKRSPKDKALLTTRKKEHRSPRSLFFARLLNLWTS